MEPVTLGIRVENGQAVRALDGLNAAFDKNTKKIEESRVKFEAWQRATTASVPPVNNLRVAQEGATLSASKLQGGLRSLATSVIGLNPQVSQLASVLGTFAVGSSVMVGVLGGLAALGLAYNQLTEDSRKFKKATDDLIESLVRQKQAAFDATIAGIQAQGGTALNRELQAQAALQKFDASGFSPAFLGVRKRLLAELGAASTAVEQTRQNEITKRKDMEEDAAARQKKNLAEIAALARKNATEAERYLNELIAKAERAASAISQMGYGRFTFAGGLDLPDVNIPGVSTAPSNSYEDDRTRAQFDASRRDVDERARAEKEAADRQEREAQHKQIQEIKRHALTTQIAANTIGNAISAITSQIGGGSIAANFGAGLGQAGASMFPAHTFAGGAFGQAIIGPILGAFGSAVGAGVDAMFDFSGSIKAAAIALKNMRRAVESSIASYEARAYGTEGSLADLERRAREDAETERAKIEESYRKGGAGQLAKPGQYAEAVAKRDSELARINAAEQAYIARLKEADAIKATTEAMNKLTTSMRNAPSGFKVEPYINRYAEGRKLGESEQLTLRASLGGGGGNGLSSALMSGLIKSGLLKDIPQDKLPLFLAKNAGSVGGKGSPGDMQFAAAEIMLAASMIQLDAANMMGGGGRVPEVRALTREEVAALPLMPSRPAMAARHVTTLNISMAGARFDLGDSKTPREAAYALVHELRLIASQTVGGNAPLADALDYA